MVLLETGLVFEQKIPSLNSMYKWGRGGKVYKVKEACVYQELIIRQLKENFPDIIIIDSERKKKVEQHYQHCNLTYDEKEKEEAEYGRYHLIIALIDEGIRFTYKIVIYENIAYINMEHCETNIANLWLEEKIENVFKKFFKNKSSKLK